MSTRSHTEPFSVPAITAEAALVALGLERIRATFVEVRGATGVA